VARQAKRDCRHGEITYHIPGDLFAPHSKKNAGGKSLFGARKDRVFSGVTGSSPNSTRTQDHRQQAEEKP
jgi:hypothetical protein